MRLDTYSKGGAQPASYSSRRTPTTFTNPSACKIPPGSHALPADPSFNPACPLINYGIAMAPCMRACPLTASHCPSLPLGCEPRAGSLASPHPYPKGPGKDQARPWAIEPPVPGVHLSG